jgi:hypothetical protein
VFNNFVQHKSKTIFGLGKYFFILVTSRQDESNFFPFAGAGRAAGAEVPGLSRGV